MLTFFLYGMYFILCMPRIGDQENSSNESAEEDQFLGGENGEVQLQHLPVCVKVYQIFIFLCFIFQ
jgi:hypothetical protein